MKLAIISDIHEDIISLRHTLRKIEKSGCDEIVCLGDISGFSVPNYRYFNTRNAHECLKLIRAHCRYIVLGNHDLNAAGKIPEYCADFEYPADWYTMDYHSRKKYSQGKVWLYDHDELDPLYTHDDIAFLSELEEFQVLEVDKRSIFFSHYVYPNLSGSLCEFFHFGSDYKRHFDFVRHRNCDLSFCGHAHSGGLYIAEENAIKQIGFRRRYEPKGMANIVIPSVAGNQIGNGFCIFDSAEGWARAERV